MVLLPFALQAFHLFEPRYRALLKDAVSGEGLVACPMLAPGWERDYPGNPAVHPVCGLGLIRHCRPYPDGRGDILLAGVGRVRILKEDWRRPYRVARMEVLEDVYPQEDDLLLERDGILHRLGLERDPRLANLPAGQAADFLAGQLLPGDREKQSFLETLDVADRLERLTRLLDRLQSPPKQTVWAAVVRQAWPGKN